MADFNAEHPYSNDSSFNNLPLWMGNEPLDHIFNPEFNDGDETTDPDTESDVDDGYEYIDPVPLQWG